MTQIKLHDNVALTEDIETQEFMTDKKILLRRGQVGTVVEEYKNGEAFEVEFSDNNGQTYALLTVTADKLILLHYDRIYLSKAS